MVAPPLCDALPEDLSMFGHLLRRHGLRHRITALVPTAW
jgi:hypothetical protein